MTEPAHGHDRVKKPRLEVLTVEMVGVDKLSLLATPTKISLENSLHGDLILAFKLIIFKVLIRSMTF